jgi:ubiquinone/menaquinone biosynthesis C-methylase UbiE
MTKLNLGGGKQKIKGFLNVDLVKTPQTDIVHDLNIFPWPFKDNSVDAIIMDNILEHLKDITPVMKELWRICRDNAKIKINVPHFASLGAYVDPTHYHFFTYYSFEVYSNESCKKSFDLFDYYTGKEKFKILKRKITYPKGLRFFEWFANKFPKFHETFLRKFLPVRNLEFELEVEK